MKQRVKKSFFAKTLLSPIGLSLIEMLVVIGMLAFVMSVIARNVSQSRKKADISKTKILIGGIERALEEFQYDCNYLPSNLEELFEAPEDCEEWGPNPYLKNRKQLKDPWNQDFVYNYDLDTDTVEIISYGADRKPGGTGKFNKDISSLD